MRITNKFQKARMLLCLLVMIFTAHQVSAQDTTFQVLAIEGDVQVKRTEAWLQLQAGQSLMPQDMIKIEKGAYLGMIHESGHTLALKKAGTYDVSKLNSELEGIKLNTAAKYGSLYVSMLNGENPKNISTERATQTNRLSVFLPNSVDVFNDEVIIRWKNDNKIDDTYEVRLKNMFNEVIETKEVSGTKTSLNFNQEKIANERMIIVSVNSKDFKDQQSNDYGMKQLTPEEAEPIKRELNELKLEITNQQSALDKLILASFFEQNSLLADALTSYEHAITLAPGIGAFEKAYEQFIFRNGLGD